MDPLVNDLIGGGGILGLIVSLFSLKRSARTDSREDAEARDERTREIIRLELNPELMRANHTALQSELQQVNAALNAQSQSINTLVGTIPEIIRESAHLGRRSMVWNSRIPIKNRRQKEG